MKTFVTSVLSVWVMTGAASAATVSHDCIGVPPAGFNPTELAGNIFWCPQFSLATTLTGMALELRGEMRGTITITNTGLAAQPGSAETNVRFDFGPLPGFTFGHPFFTIHGNTGAVTVGPGATSTFPVAGLLSGTANNSTRLLPYVGDGTFTIPVTTNTFLLLGFFGGKVNASQATEARANARVTYTYDEATTVPEPTSVTLVGIGSVGGALLRRRRGRLSRTSGEGSIGLR